MREIPSFLSTDPHRYTFRFMGRSEGWFTFRAPTWRTKHRNKMDALEFENEIFAWMFETVRHTDYFLGNGSADGYPDVPEAFRTGNCLIVKLRALPDVLRFEQFFPVAGLEPQHLLAA